MKCQIIIELYKILLTDYILLCKMYELFFVHHPRLFRFVREYILKDKV